MMRCSNCNRDYPGDLQFCHQCGEPLQATEWPLKSLRVRAEPGAARGHSRVPARRRAPARPTSLYFALLVLLAAGVGLALVWHQWWIPSLVRVSARLPPEQAPRPIDQLVPRDAPGAAATESPAAAPAPEPASPLAPPPPAMAPAPMPAPAPVAESAPRKAAPRPDPPAPDPGRPAGPARQPAPARPTPAARSEPGASLLFSGSTARSDPAPAPTAGLRVISLVPVGTGASTGARGQLYWESGSGGRLVVSGLPQPPPGRSYQLWLGSIKLGNRASGGLLIVDAQGAGTLRVAPPRATWSPDIFGVTVERQGGAREPSDELVLVGELTRQAAAKEPGSTAAGSTAPGPAGAVASSAAPEARPPSTPVSSTPAPLAFASETSPPAVTASVPPPAPAPDGVLRIVPVPVERAWFVAQSALRSLGWDIDRADRAEGLIRTEPRNVEFTNLGVYAAGTRHALDVVVRAVSSSHTSIAVKRQLFEEQRILWSKERTILPSGDTAVEETVLDAIEPLL